MRTEGVTVVVDDGFVEHVRAGRIEVVPEIDRFTEHRVRLVDGRDLTPEVVLTATGYRHGLRELLPDQPDVVTEAGRRCAARHGLRFVGFTPAISGNLWQHPAEARRVSRAIARDLRSKSTAVPPWRAIDSMSPQRRMGRWSGELLGHWALEGSRVLEPRSRDRAPWRRAGS